VQTIKDYRERSYEPTEWEDEVKDSNGNVMVDGTPVAEPTLGNLETGMLLSHLDIGSTLLMALQLANLNQKEIEKYQKQRLLQGRETISNNISDNGYFRSSEPFVTVSLDGFAQLNAPDYDVVLTPTNDEGDVGKLIAYDKTQNGFKVKMTGSAKSVSFLWTLINPNV